MSAYVHAAWRRCLTTISHEQCRIGANLFRIGTGLTILYEYLTTYHQRDFLYGPLGVIPFEWFVQHQRQTESFSLYALDRSPLVFEVIFHLGILVTAVWVLGWHTRLMTCGAWAFFWSLHQRNPMIWDGGDNLIQIVLIFACFANLGEYSPDTARSQTEQGQATATQQVLALLHNTALFAIATQLCLVYGAAGIYKLQGELWQHGTALYYILRAGEFAWTGYGAMIAQQSAMVTLLTYGTVAFQVSFPFLFFTRDATRRLALVIGIAFHVGIALMMGLTTFAAFMISIELMFIPDRDYRALQAAGRALWQWMRRSSLGGCG